MANTARVRPAFTLIELLIVVAIIAILAAIAVPNFLEAQTRSKLSRVKTDMRTMAVALECYITDHNAPPPGQNDYVDLLGLSLRDANLRAQVRLTTPVAYLTSIPLDPFFVAQNDPHERKQYTYMAFDKGDTGPHYACFVKGYTWGLQSKGPSMKNPPTGYGMQNIVAIPYVDDIYDATNGTNSSGVVIRTNKGEFLGTD